MRERTKLFTEFFFEIKNKKETSVIAFGDIHWADEATLDFIKFFARRITQLKCVFILTYRDDEIHSHHPLRNVLSPLLRIELNKKILELFGESLKQSPNISPLYFLNLM